MPRVAAAALKDAIRGLLAARELPASHANDVAESLVEASLMGIDSHGVRLLATYLQELDNGRANRTPNFRVGGTFGAAATFDADNALGIVGGCAAMREAIARAKRYGVAAISVTNSNHFGAAGIFARMAARENQIGLVFSNSDALVGAAGGTRRVNGTNPLAMAVQADDDDGFFLDMATSQISYSKVMRMIAEGVCDDRMAGIRVGADGSVTLPPLGGYKGQGLGLMVQILCALLSGMPFDASLTHLYEPPYDAPRQIGHFMMAIEIAAFMDPRTLRARLSDLLARFRDDPSAADSHALVPGDLERLARTCRLREGIPLSEDEYETFRAILAVPQRCSG